MDFAMTEEQQAIFDMAYAFGTDSFDDIAVRAANVYEENERLAFGGTMEVLNVDASGGDDQIVMSASFAADTTISGGDDNDTVEVTSTTHAVNLGVMMGAGDDTTIVRRTHVDTTLMAYGEAGDDTMIVGSSEFENNGNLSQIRGPVSFDGGDSVLGDRLVASDAGIMGGFSYEISDSFIQTHPGRFNIDRTNFAVINYGSVESVRLDGTQAV